MLTPTIKRSLTLLAVAFSGFVAGFAVHAALVANAPTPLSVTEARLIGEWQQFSVDQTDRLDSITFLPNREMRIGNTGMAGHWAVQDDNLIVHSLYDTTGGEWGNTPPDAVEYEFAFSGSSDRLVIGGGENTQAVLVREL